MGTVIFERVIAVSIVTDPSVYVTGHLSLTQSKMQRILGKYEFLKNALASTRRLYALKHLMKSIKAVIMVAKSYAGLVLPECLS